MKAIHHFALMISMVVAPNLAWAADYGYCEIAGFAYGAKKELVASVAARIAEKSGLTPSDKACGAVWREAYQIGARMGQGFPSSEADFDSWKRMQDLEKKILDALIKQMAL